MEYRVALVFGRTDGPMRTPCAVNRKYAPLWECFCLELTEFNGVMLR